MRASFVTWRRRQPPVRLLLLVALLFRAYVPAGYMPASGAPFQLVLCPASAPMPAHHHHAGLHAHVEVCPFSDACAGGPVSHVLSLPAAEPAAMRSVLPPESWLGGIQQLSPPARGPPIAA